MKTLSQFQSACIFILALLFLAACEQKRQEAPPDHPRLTANVTMQDVSFHSAALDRDMQYRVVLPNRTGPRNCRLSICSMEGEEVFVIGRTIPMRHVSPSLG